MSFWTHLVVAYGAWVLLVWPINLETRSVQSVDLIVGLGVAALVALVARSENGVTLSRVLDPRRWGWALAFLVVLAVHIVRANLDVARRVLSPSLPIRPGIVKIKTQLPLAAVPLLANAITLTPGTLTVDVGTEPGVLYVHWIDVEQRDVQAVTEQIAGRFEQLIKKAIGRDGHA